MAFDPQNRYKNHFWKFPLPPFELSSTPNRLVKITKILLIRLMCPTRNRVKRNLQIHCNTALLTFLLNCAAISSPWEVKLAELTGGLTQYASFSPLDPFAPPSPDTRSWSAKWRPTFFFHEFMHTGGAANIAKRNITIIQNHKNLNCKEYFDNACLLPTKSVVTIRSQ